MLRVGFEPTIPVLERAKAFHVIGRTATVIVFTLNYLIKLLIIIKLNITNHVFGIKELRKNLNSLPVCTLQSTCRLQESSVT
jgi:hypothetical protein